MLKKDAKNFEDRVLPGLNDSANIRYDEDSYRDNVLNESNIRLDNYDKAGANEKQNFKKSKELK